MLDIQWGIKHSSPFPLSDRISSLKGYTGSFCLLSAIFTISASESPAYQFTAYVIHQFDYLSKLCKAAYLNAVSQNLNNFESQMSGLNECTNIVWDIISHDAGAAGGSTEVSRDGAG